MKRYEKFAEDIAELIRSGVLGPGQRVPSVRYASQTYGVSPSTVFQAYYLLERRGLIRAKPRSGYFVNTHTPAPSVNRCSAAMSPNPPRWMSAPWCFRCWTR